VIFPHFARYAINHLIQRGVHIISFGTGFDCDVIAATQNYLSTVAVFLNVQDKVNVHNPRIFQMKTRNLASKIVLHCRSDGNMSSG
jgi:hypothetical protein